MNQRLRKLQNDLHTYKLDALLISNHHNIYYLSNFVGLSPYEREAWILITKHEGYLFTNSLYYSHAKKNHPDFAVYEITPDHPLISYIHKFLPKKTTLGFESQSLSHLEYQHFKNKFLHLTFTPTQHIVETLREYKDTKEMNAIKQAVMIIDEVWENAPKQIRVGQTELEVAFELEIQTRKSKADDIAWRPIIVASGTNSANPHHVTSDKKISKGDLILIDMGASYERYVSDFTRILFTAPPTEKQQKVYHAVCEANRIAEENIHLGIEREKLDRLARETLTKHGFNLEKEQYPHLLGHGIGLEIHEKPSLGTYSSGVIEDNTAFTIEPAIYLENEFGIRIEDTVIVENGKTEVLTKSSKEIIII